MQISIRVQGSNEWPRTYDKLTTWSHPPLPLHSYLLKTKWLQCAMVWLRMVYVTLVRDFKHPDCRTASAAQVRLQLSCNQFHAAARTKEIVFSGSSLIIFNKHSQNLWWYWYKKHVIVSFSILHFSFFILQLQWKIVTTLNAYMQVLKYLHGFQCSSQ